MRPLPHVLVACRPVIFNTTENRHVVPWTEHGGVGAEAIHAHACSVDSSTAVGDFVLLVDKQESKVRGRQVSVPRPACVTRASASYRWENRPFVLSCRYTSFSLGFPSTAGALRIAAS